MNDIIRFEQVTKAYGDQVILKAFDQKIRKGEFLTVIGSSGSGKTTMSRSTALRVRSLSCWLSRLGT